MIVTPLLDVLCKAHWISLFLKCAIQIQLPCLTSHDFWFALHLWYHGDYLTLTFGAHAKRGWENLHLAVPHVQLIRQLRYMAALRTLGATVYVLYATVERGGIFWPLKQAVNEKKNQWLRGWIIFYADPAVWNQGHLSQHQYDELIRMIDGGL